MNCLNCNKDTVGTAVFCEDCLAAMAAHPVAKGTPVIIPKQPSPIVQRKHNRELLGSLEETLSISRRTVRRLVRTLIFLSVLLVITGCLLAYILINGIPDFLLDIHLPL